MDAIIRHVDFDGLKSLKATNQYFDVKLERVLMKKSKLVLNLEKDDEKKFESFINIASVVSDCVKLNFENCEAALAEGSCAKFLHKFGGQIKNLELKFKSINDMKFLESTWDKLISLDTLKLNSKLVFFPLHNNNNGGNNSYRKREKKKKVRRQRHKTNSKNNENNTSIILHSKSTGKICCKVICLPYLCLYNYFVCEYLRNVDFDQVEKICSPVQGERLSRIFRREFFLNYNVLLDEYKCTLPQFHNKDSIRSTYFYYKIARLPTINDIDKNRDWLQSDSDEEHQYNDDGDVILAE